LDPILNADGLTGDNLHNHLSPVYKTVSLLKNALPNQTALIGFAGSPWTVATYMIAGRGTPAQEPAHDLMRKDEKAFASIIDLLVQSTADYLTKQVENGAQCLQLFDSWASSLSGDALEKYCFEPNRQIVQKLRANGINVPIIGFPRAIGKSVKSFAETVGVDAVGLDQSLDLEWACKELPTNIVTQGNLDPALLVKGGAELNHAVSYILDVTQGRRHIFNLGHGIVPQTPVENVAQVFDILNRASLDGVGE